MAYGSNDQSYTNLERYFLTLSDVNEKGKNYPAVVKFVKGAQEIHGLQYGVEILLEKPKYIQYVRISILDYENEERQRAFYDEESITDRNRYIGKEFLIPLGYRGNFKFLSKTGRYATLISISQIIQDLPRFIVVEEDTLYTAPGHSHPTTSIAAGTKLEVRRAFTIENNWYIECRSDTSNIYRFREDFPLNCSCVNDPEVHTFQDITDKSIPLPKKAMFQKIPSTDVLNVDLNEASALLKVIEGPIKILETNVHRKIFIAWMTRGDRGVQKVILIPRNIWNTQYIELKIFQSDLERQVYINHNFGENIDSGFVSNKLYTMSPDTNEVTLIKAPPRHTDGNSANRRALNYENAGGDDTEYVKLWSNSPAIPPRPKSFKKRTVSLPATASRQVQQNDIRMSAKGRQPFRDPTIQERQESFSVTDKSKKGFDKLDTYCSDDDRGCRSQSKEKLGHQEQNDVEHEKSATFPDVKKSSQAKQSKEDFYSYSVEELVECFKICGLERLADECHTNKLDGAFFRDFSIDDLLSEPFCLNKFQLYKVKMVIENGWRPKSECPK